MPAAIIAAAARWFRQNRPGRRCAVRLKPPPDCGRYSTIISASSPTAGLLPLQRYFADVTAALGAARAWTEARCDLNAQSTCGEHAWELSARAVAIEPTLELFNFAQTLKGKNGEPVDIYFITGRFEDPVERAATEWNLHKVGYDKWRQLFMRDASKNFKNVSVYKTWARTQIEADHIIIANVGDQFSDLVGDQSGDHAERCFKVPNPFYFIPGDPLPSGGLKCLANK